MITSQSRIARRLLGRTGLEVSAISLGTVELGLDYGIPMPGQYGKPDERDAIRLIREAFDHGINLFDTAPAYGESEELLGKSLSHHASCIFATKVTIPRDAEGRIVGRASLGRQIRRSLERSLRALRRENLDIVQVHNATDDAIRCDELWEVLSREKEQGLLRHIGASVYTPEEALGVIKGSCCDVLQIPFNLLDQRMSAEVFPAAEKTGVGLMSRSTFLKGALTTRARWLPPELTKLQEAVERVKTGFGLSWDELPQFALRFCLSIPWIATVLVGVRTAEEFLPVLDGMNHGPLPAQVIAVAQKRGTGNLRLVNPMHWGIP